MEYSSRDYQKQLVVYMRVVAHIGAILGRNGRLF